MADLNCQYYFLLALKDLFASICTSPQTASNAKLLLLFLKYSDEIQDLTAKRLAALKTELGKLEGIDVNVKDYLLDELNNIHLAKNRIEDPEYMTRGIAILKDIITELIALLEKGEDKRIVALADAVHNFPEMITKSETWKPIDFWKKYIEPYRKKWDRGFLDKWKADFR